jgi:hypothetical protein
MSRKIEVVLRDGVTLDWYKDDKDNKFKLACNDGFIIINNFPKPGRNADFCSTTQELYAVYPRELVLSAKVVEEEDE